MHDTLHRDTAEAAAALMPLSVFEISRKFSALERIYLLLFAIYFVLFTKKISSLCLSSTTLSVVSLSLRPHTVTMYNVCFYDCCNIFFSFAFVYIWALALVCLHGVHCTHHSGH